MRMQYTSCCVYRHKNYTRMGRSQNTKLWLVRNQLLIDERMANPMERYDTTY